MLFDPKDSWENSLCASAWRQLEQLLWMSGWGGCMVRSSSLLIWHLLASCVCLSLTYHQALAMFLVDYFVLLNMYMYICVLSCFRHVWLIATLWTVARQAPLPMGFSRQEYWSGLPHPPPGSLSNPGIKPASPKSPALAGEFFATSATTYMCICVRPTENWTRVFCVFCIASRFFITKPPGSPTGVYICVHTHRRCKRCRFDPWVMKTLWRRAWQPTSVFLPEESHGHWSLAGHRP